MIVLFPDVPEIFEKTRDILKGRRMEMEGIGSFLLCKDMIDFWVWGVRI